MLLDRLKNGLPISSDLITPNHICIFLEELSSKNESTRKLAFLILCALLRIPGQSNTLLCILKQPKVNSPITFSDLNTLIDREHTLSVFSNQKQRILDKMINQKQLLFWRFSLQSDKFKFNDIEGLLNAKTDLLLARLPDPAAHFCGGFFGFGISVSFKGITSVSKDGPFETRKRKIVVAEEKGVKAIIGKRIGSLFDHRRDSLQTALSKTFRKNKFGAFNRDDFQKQQSKQRDSTNRVCSSAL